MTGAQAQLDAGGRDVDRERLRGLVVDWGGVLTNALDDCIAAFCESDGIDDVRFRGVLRELLGEAVSSGSSGSSTSSTSSGPTGLAHGIERGEVPRSQFERALADRLTTRDGRPVEATGLLDRLFARFDANAGMAGVVRRARAAGIRTALCSNSWGNDYPREEWDGMFDAVVISGEVGMRKPEPAIYLHTARLLGLPASRCVFVDDLPSNVRGAVAAGMVGVRHVTTEQTVAELEALFDVELDGSDRSG